MSQHFLYADLDGQQVEIQMGWDTPMDWYYLLISPVLDNEVIDDPIYSNLDEPNANSNDLSFYVGVCRKMGIDIPIEMVEGIEEDRRTRRMNHRVVYGA